MTTARRRRSAAYRIAFVSSAVFALAVMLLGAAVYFAADAAFRKQQDTALAETMAELTRVYGAEGEADLIETLRRRGGNAGVITFGYALFDRSGRRVAGDLDLPLPHLGYTDVVFNDPVEGPDAARALTTRLKSGSTLVVGVDAQALERVDRAILTLFGSAFIAVIGIGAGGALALGGYLSRRLERISGTALAIMDGDLKRRVPVSTRGDEFDDLGRVLNAMLDRIGRLLDNLRQVSADVAHDLRTPLARLRGSLDEARTTDDAVTRCDALNDAVTQSDALLALFGGILRIVEVDTGDIRIGFESIDLTALTQDLCDSYAPAVADGGRTLSCTIAPLIQVLGDRELLAQAVINLLDNAQAHTPPDTAIMITLCAVNDMAELSVADDGPGVPAGTHGRIVERFVRLDRSRSAAGHGLGLNLVDAIARAHSGLLTIADNAPGLRTTLTLPVLR